MSDGGKDTPNETADDPMILAHLRRAVRRAEARDFAGAQINVAYADSRLRDLCGPLCFKTEDEIINGE